MLVTGCQSFLPQFFSIFSIAPAVCLLLCKVTKILICVQFIITSFLIYLRSVLTILFALLDSISLSVTTLFFSGFCRNISLSTTSNCFFHWFFAGHCAKNTIAIFKIAKNYVPTKRKSYLLNRSKIGKPTSLALIVKLSFWPFSK